MLLHALDLAGALPNGENLFETGLCLSVVVRVQRLQNLAHHRSRVLQCAAKVVGHIGNKHPIFPLVNGIVETRPDDGSDDHRQQSSKGGHTPSDRSTRLSRPFGRLGSCLFFAHQFTSFRSLR